MHRKLVIYRSSIFRSTILFLILLLVSGTEMFAQKLAVISRWQDKVVFLDLETGDIRHTVETGDFPHELVTIAGHRFAYVPAYAGNTVTKIDLWNQAATDKFDLGKHNALHGAYLSRDGRSLWVTSEEQRSIIEIDTETGSIKNEWNTGQYRSHMVTAVPESGKLYVANIDSGSVSIIDMSRDKPAILYTGAGAEGIDRSPDGEEVWVSNRGANTISVIDVATDEIIKSIPSGGDFPVKLKFRPDGSEVWVANNRSGTVSVFDSETYTLKTTIQTGGRPLGLAFSDDSRFGYITRPGSNQVVEVDIEDNHRVTRRLDTLPSPDGVVWVDRQD